MLVSLYPNRPQRKLPCEAWGYCCQETSSQSSDGRRVWTVQLADKKLGRIRLAIDFTQPIAADQLSNWTLPTAQTENVAYQSGLVAVEGDAELDINVKQHPRTVDMGELVDAEYQVGSRLLGVYSYVGTDDTVTIIGQRRALHGLPTTIVERAELVSLIGAGGISQTAARFLLRTKAQYLEVRLPEGLHSGRSWSMVCHRCPSDKPIASSWRSRVHRPTNSAMCK